MSDWGLEGIKVGDLVLVGYGQDERLIRVNRLTKTQVIAGKHDIRFRVKDGAEVGQGRDTWGGTRRARIPSREDIARVQHRWARRKAKVLVDDPILTLTQLKAIIKICAGTP